MKWTVLFLLFIFIFFFSVFEIHAAEPSPSNIVLSPGRTFEWKIRGNSQISLSNGSVVKVKDLKDSLKITALRQGSALLKTLGPENPTSLYVRVTKESTYRLFEGLISIIQNRRGLSVYYEQDTVKVKGQLLRFEDWLALSDAPVGTSEVFEFQAMMTKSLEERAKIHFKELIKQAGLPDLSMTITPSASATVPEKSKELKAQAEKLLGPYGFRIISSESALTLEPLVRVRIIVAEFKKSLTRTWGIEWPSAAQATLLPSGLLKFSTLEAEIQALETKGLGKILASPTLLCRSGKEAEFLAGGEIPIRIVSPKTKDIIWRKYGVVLKINPVADRTGRMSIAIETEVSTLDSSQSVGGIPGFLTNRIVTHFDLTESRTIALSGLIKKEWGDSLKGLPGLSSLPVLGSLFSSRDFREGQTELVIFVTPEIEMESENHGNR